jgi:hypothetical protein
VQERQVLVNGPEAVKRYLEASAPLGVTNGRALLTLAEASHPCRCCSTPAVRSAMDLLLGWALLCLRFLWLRPAMLACCWV